MKRYLVAPACLLANGVPRKIIASTLKVSRTTLSIALKPYAMGPHPQMRRYKATPPSGPDSAPQAEATPLTERRG